MKLRDLILILFLIFSIESGFGQVIIQSTCSNDTACFNQDVEEFSLRIVLSHMNNFNHHYHDSILAPKSFLDSIKNYVSAYHNAINLSDSIIDYREFNDYYQDSEEIVLAFNRSSYCFNKQNGKLIIANDTLSRYIDSLNLYAESFRDYEIVLSDSGSGINMTGDFNFFKDIACITDVEYFFGAQYQPPCSVKSRSGIFKDDELTITLLDYNYCGSNSYSYVWRYTITKDCKIKIEQIPTSETALFDDINVEIFPNPFENGLNVKASEKLKSLRLIGLNGRIYRQRENFVETYLNTADLATGLYVIVIISNDGKVTCQKLLKK